MSKKILVAYATISGSTGEIANNIAEELRSLGLEADSLPMRSVKSLTGYDAVILGTSLYMFRWHGDTNRFLARHKAALTAGLPVALFAGGPFHTEEKEWTDVRAQLDKTLAKFPWFKPVSVQVVGGRFDPAKLGFPYSLFFPMKKMPPSDIRDWGAIRAWAKEIMEKMKFI